ncbi:MAG: Hpt domain-containing protein [Magnetococcales bacterium]|nr:Hpt domain-containing protein [Magnetococcales bacterium]
MPASCVTLDLGVLADLRSDLEEEFPTIVNISLQAISERASAIQEALARRDMGAVRSAAHQIKSSSRQLGAMRVGQIAEQLERLAAAEPPPNLQAWGETLLVEVGSAKKAILECKGMMISI